MSGSPFANAVNGVTVAQLSGLLLYGCVQVHLDFTRQRQKVYGYVRKLGDQSPASVTVLEQCVRLGFRTPCDLLLELGGLEQDRSRES
jgi:hypothetical protein